MAESLHREINYIVLDYLVQEGYPAVAAKFAAEANIEVRDEGDLGEERVRIRKAIFRGDLRTAIEEINDINPQVSRTTSTSYCPL